MFVDSNIISPELWHILFECTLFGLVGILCYQLYTTYVHPALTSYIYSLRTEWKELHNKKQLLERTRQQVEDDITTQQTQLNSLNKKIEIWYDKQQARIDRIIRKREDDTQKIYAKRELQAKAIALHKTREEVIPRAVEEARNEFLTTYEGEEGYDLLSRLITRLDQQLER